MEKPVSIHDRTYFDVEITLHVSASSMMAAKAHCTLFMNGETSWDDSGIVYWNFPENCGKKEQP